jgi:tRNA nucleotidyltransferase (CCA-adding enzyme)
VDLLARLSAAPGADVVLAAVGEEDGVHVVGGAVRDVLLDGVPHELDVVVEGDAVGVARRAARRVGGTLTVHERFGTATVAVAGFAFDLAGARRERYPQPGALPVVELGATLKEDLARRDFTVNAIAVRLADGALTAWDGARADLAAGVLRVLHERSFVDDPTRMLRLARYAARLGFEPDPATDALVDPALFATVSGDRLGRELRLLLSEPKPAALLWLERHALGRALLGDGFRAAPVDAAPLVALAAGCTAIPPEKLAARLDHLGFTARERKLVVTAAGAYERLHAALAPGGTAAGGDAAAGGLAATGGGRAAGDDAAPAGEPSDADLWRLFHRLPPEAAEVVVALDGPAARRWLDDVRHRRLSITGDDLIAAGLTGAAVGAALERATIAMLEGRAQDRESQLAAALA